MRKAFPRQGFTLIELLVVISIIVILGALSIPAITASLRSSALTQGAQKISVELTSARQAALTQNRSVEVRFYQFAQSGWPGETAGNPATGKFRAVQSFVYDPSGTATALDKIQVLPNTVIMDSGSALSPLLSSTLTKSWTATDPQVSLPNVGTSYNARVFQFQPDGSTNLNPLGQQWFITLHISTGDNLATLPTNFCVLGIDPLNGHIQSFRP